MVHYKLFYFPLRGRAEAIRQLFKLAGAKYEEETVSWEEWPQLKATLPMGQLPVLEVDGQQIAQSVAILRFLGHAYQLAGRNPVETARLDMIADYVAEFRNSPGIDGWNDLISGAKGGDKVAYFKDNVMPLIEKYAPTVERFLLENGNDIFAGETETWVDLYVAEVFSRIEDYGVPGSLSAYPHILELIRRVHNVPAIKKHIEERPVYNC